MDNVSKRQRSKIMAAVKSKGNLSTERAVARLLRANKITGWRQHLPGIPGKPDFSFPMSRVAVFVDGCFWHGHKCRSILPQQNREYWRLKVLKNKCRDVAITKTLESHGWKVIRIWECAISQSKIARISKVISQAFIVGSKRKQKHTIRRQNVFRRNHKNCI